MKKITKTLEQYKSEGNEVKKCPFCNVNGYRKEYGYHDFGKCYKCNGQGFVTSKNEVFQSVKEHQDWLIEQENARLIAKWEGSPEWVDMKKAREPKASLYLDYFLDCDSAVAQDLEAGLRGTQER